MRIAVGLLLVTALSVAGESRTYSRPLPTWTPHPTWGKTAHSPTVQRGLAWLAESQGKDGGWGQDGGEDAGGGRTSRKQPAPAGNDLANTSLAALTFLRAGTTPTSGPYREALSRATEFVVAEVERAPKDGLAVSRRTGTQIQGKLGPYVDSFLATMHLSQVDGKIPDAKLAHRVREALEKCLAKVQAHQGRDGSWNAAGGWAPLLSTSLASRGLMMAQTGGLEVDEEVLRRARAYFAKSFDERTGRFTASGTAGIDLYAVAQTMEEVTRLPGATTTPVYRAAVDKLEDRAFLSGFGSMGGEEFISYLNLSDSLVRLGGEKWHRWNDRMRKHLGSLQNEDGTWAGHHCITGRTACTSAAVLTLLAERTVPKPEEE